MYRLSGMEFPPEIVLPGTVFTRCDETYHDCLSGVEMTPHGAKVFVGQKSFSKNTPGLLLDM